MTALVLAALSAVLYGAGTAFEHRQAVATPASSAGRPRLLLLLIRQPVWLVGAACEVAGFAAHSAALAAGPLAAVQLLLSCSLIVSLAITSRFRRTRVARRCWPWVVAVVLGVGGCVSLLPTDGHSASADSGGRLALAAVATGLVAAPVIVAAFICRGRARPVLLGCAAGLTDACIAVITMAFARVVPHGFAIGTAWSTYALIVGGLVSLVVTQTAYQANRPLITLPLITAAMPLACMTVGAAVLGETTHLSPARIAGVAVCMVVAVIGLVRLARASAAAERQDHGATRTARRRSTPASGPRPTSVQPQRHDLEFYRARRSPSSRCTLPVR